MCNERGCDYPLRFIETVNVNGKKLDVYYCTNPKERHNFYKIIEDSYKWAFPLNELERKIFLESVVGKKKQNETSDTSQK